MGPDAKLNGSGTFGGYVELKNREGEWKRFGLNCYHVIQPEMKGETLNNANVGDGNAEEVLCPTQPSRADYNEHIQQTQRKIWDAKNDPDYLDRLGEVFAASGYRTRKATAYGGKVHVHWALIEVSFDRLGDNAINTEGTPKFNLPNETIQATRDLVVGVRGEPFSLEGDSGAFVFDRALALVGMLFSGHSSRKVSYMTSCKDLFADIVEVTGAEDIRVPI